MHADRRPPARDNLPLAAATIVLSVFALSLGDAVIKQLGAGFVLWQIFVLRAVLVLPVLIGVMRWQGLPLRLAAPVWTGLRSAMLVLMWVLYYLALPHVPLPVAAAGFYTLPLFITLFSGLFLRAPIGPSGWAAMALGFGGVLLILRPDASGVGPMAALPLVSAMLYAGAMLLTRMACRSEAPLTLALALNAGFLLAGLVATAALVLLPDAWRHGPLTARWTAIDATGAAAMVLLAASILIGSLGAAYAYQRANPSQVGAFDFAYVGFAVLWGAWIFGDTLSWLSVAGIVMIVAAGLLSLRLRLRPDVQSGGR